MSERVVVIGGGASGVLAAAHLLRRPGTRFDVTLIEPDESVGRGLAYSTDDPAHLLNTRTGNMSAFEDDPLHFSRWLADSGEATPGSLDTPFSFAPRRLYRRYLTDLLRPWSAEDGDGRLRIVKDTCIGLAEAGGRVTAHLGSGASETADRAILAIGHALTLGHSPYDHAWSSPEALGISPDEDILILGTGLSMIDNVAALHRRGHRGRIVALSRRALLPRVHAPTSPFRLDPADIPFGTGPAYFLRWLRRTIRWAESQGRDWREVMDALRPHVSAVWAAMPHEARARFLRHGRTLWDVHRHRMPPELGSLVEAARASGHLDLVAGRIVEDTAVGGRRRVTIRRRDGSLATITVDRIIDCTGILRPFDADGTGLVAQLLSSGTARRDPLAIGLDVADDGALINAAGRPSRRIHAVGPVTKARFWEITAIPDIRAHTERLVGRLTAQAERSLGIA